MCSNSKNDREFKKRLSTPTDWKNANIYCQTQKTVNTLKISVMLIVYWPITINSVCEQTSKPQINHRCCLRFSYLAPYWLISRNTITFNKYFWCSRFCEFHSNNGYEIHLKFFWGGRSPALKWSHLIKIHEYLIQKTQTLHTFTIGIQLSVEIRKITDAREHDDDFITRLVIKFLWEQHNKNRINNNMPEKKKTKFWEQLQKDCHYTNLHHFS